MQGWRGRSPLHRLRCHPEGTSADVWCPKDLVLTELFLGQRGAGEVVCTAPTQLNVYEYGKSLCKNKTTQWFLYYFAFYKYKQLCLTIIIRSFTSKHSVQAPRRPCKFGRHEILRAQNSLRTRPQDDIVFLAGASPLHPLYITNSLFLSNYYIFAPFIKN